MGDTASSGDEAFATFATVGVTALVGVLIEMQGILDNHALLKQRDAIAKTLTWLLEELNKIAIQIAGTSEGLIIRKIIETASRNRPHSGEMEAHIVSKPGPLGSVKVALLAELERIVNPRGFGPFWRAQEFGTGSEEVPSQEGRLLFGTFEPSGEPPDAAQRGLGAGHDLAFIPHGSAPGFGVISVELPARHFLTDGATEAGVEYEARMQALQEEVVSRVRRVVEEVPTGPQAGGGFTGVIEA